MYLAGNRPHPGSHTPFFKDKSPKLQFSLNTLDLRVLFVVNTADLVSHLFFLRILTACLNAINRERGSAIHVKKIIKQFVNEDCVEPVIALNTSVDFSNVKRRSN